MEIIAHECIQLFQMEKIQLHMILLEKKELIQIKFLINWIIF